MTDRKAHGQNATMADWLNLHGLDPEFCIAILRLGQNAHKLSEPPIARPQITLPCSEEARSLCTNALAQALPNNCAALARLSADTIINFSPDIDRFPRAFTLHNDGHGRPYISCPWQGELSDFLKLAHELGHALQIILSEGRDMPPVSRETCAVLSEAWLIDHLSSINHSTAAPLKRLQHRRNAQVLMQDGKVLLAALKNPSQPYTYNWNYPIAAHFAPMILKQNDPSFTEAFFANMIPLIDLTHPLKN